MSFLCHGNVCRSPLAERYVRACLNERGDQGFTVESAGFIEREGRTSPDFAVEAARAYDIDLTDHRSKRVTADLLARSDLVVVMDAKNYGQLRREFDGATDRAYFLEPFRGDAGNGGDFEIDDPYDQTAEGYERAYRAVTAAIDGLLERTTPRVGIDVEYPLKSLKTARTPRGSKGRGQQSRPPNDGVSFVVLLPPGVSSAAAADDSTVGTPAAGSPTAGGERVSLRVRAALGGRRRPAGRVQ